jgi:RNA polymerase sigma factor (TIGR02999 family)
VDPDTGAEPRMESNLGQLIDRADAGDGRAADEMFSMLYRELHRLAERQLRRHGPALSLGTTTLLHEAYLHFAEPGTALFSDKPRFFAYASRAMRWIVIDYARRSRAQRRGGGASEIQLTDAVAEMASGVTAPELEQLSDALDDLAKLNPVLAQLVDLHFFCGFSFVEIAALRDVSDRTVQRDWRKARLLLHHALLDDDPPAASAGT